MDLKMMLIVHKDKPAVERFAQAVLAEGIAGLTLMPSAGRGRTQGENYDEFRFSFTHIFESREIPNTTIFSILPESHIPRMLELLEERQLSLQGIICSSMTALEICEKADGDATFWASLVEAATTEAR